MFDTPWAYLNFRILDMISKWSGCLWGGVGCGGGVVGLWEVGGWAVPICTLCASPCQSIKINPANMYIAWARTQFQIHTHTHTHVCVERNTCAFQTGCQLFSTASAMTLGLCFRRNFYGMKRTCWTTGSWRYCLSLEVASSIPAWSTIIYQFLCGLFAFRCALASILTQQICISLAVLLQSGGSEFDPRLVDDNIAVPLWAICVSLCLCIKSTHTHTHIYIYIYILHVECGGRGVIGN